MKFSAENKVFLLGHSFGGYLAALYSCKHPELISKLVLADCWGIPKMPEEDDDSGHNPFET